MHLFKKSKTNYLVLFILINIICSYAFADTLNKAVEAGKNEYARSCELCHGATGKGDGPYASRLLIKPADLTIIKKTNNGKFPIASIYRMIDGSDDITFHGGRRMPIWGSRYRSESIFEVNPEKAETFVRGRIFELLLYLDTIQVE